MQKLIFLTGNKDKAKNTRAVLTGKYGIDMDILNPDFEIPEIQADNCADVAKFSAKYACEKLGFPVLKSDTGLYCDCLGGLPGAYVKYFHKQIGCEKFLRMIKDEKNRKARIEYCFAYCEPGQEPIVFCGGGEGSISYELSKSEIDSFYCRFYIPDGETKTLDDIMAVDPKLERIYWGDARDQFAKWYLARF